MTNKNLKIVSIDLGKSLKRFHSLEFMRRSTHFTNKYKTERVEYFSTQGIYYVASLPLWSAIINLNVTYNTLILYLH